MLSLNRSRLCSGLDSRRFLFSFLRSLFKFGPPLWINHVQHFIEKSCFLKYGVPYPARFWPQRFGSYPVHYLCHGPASDAEPKYTAGWPQPGILCRQVAPACRRQDRPDRSQPVQYLLRNFSTRLLPYKKRFDG